MNNSENRVINRNDYIAEYEIKDIDLNVSKFGEVESKNGGGTKPPVPGYCIRFDKNNPNAYIETYILSSERDNYRIIIKGEGTKEFLYADTSEKFINIRSYKTLADSDYFNVSYIAFLNLSTGNVDHLFECEESDGLLLYDARSTKGDYAFIRNVASISSLRTSALTKEYITDPKNLKDALNLEKWSYNTTSKTKYSIVNETTFFTLKITPEEDKKYDRYQYVLIGTCPRSSANTGWVLTKASANWYAIDVCHDGVIERVWSAANTEFSNGKENKCCLIISPTGVKFYVNDKLTTLSTSISNATTSHHFGLNHNNSSLQIASEVSNIICIGNNVEESGLYSQDDYLAGKDLPNSLLLSDDLRLYTKNISTVNNCWLDASLKNDNIISYTQSGSIPFQAPYKCYGTWINNIGCNNIRSNYTTFCPNVGQDIAFTTLEGNTVYGFTGDKHSTYTDAEPVTIGGIGAPYNVETGTTYQGLHNISADYTPIESSALYASKDTISFGETAFNTNLANSGVAYCLYRDPTSDPDCPSEVKHAIDYLQFTRPSLSWENFSFGDYLDLRNRVSLQLQFLGYPTGRAAKLIFRSSVWAKRLDNPMESWSEYTSNNAAKAGFYCGTISGLGVQIPLGTMPKTWTKYSYEFEANSYINYYWQWGAGVAAWIDISDKTRRTVLEPLVSFANPRLELVKAIDPVDGTTIIEFSDTYNRYYPRHVEEFNIGDLVL